MTTEQQIEAILFYKGEPVSLSTLSKLLSRSEVEIRDSLEKLKESYTGRGTALVLTETAAELRVNPDMSDLIRTIAKEELSQSIGKAGAETLAIVLYRGSVTRAEIDYIRGVNSTFMLRNLLIRGLIERISNPKDQRSYLYKPTHELLAHLGVSSVKDLPDYGKIVAELETFIQEQGSDEIVSS